MEEVEAIIEELESIKTHEDEGESKKYADLQDIIKGIDLSFLNVSPPEKRLVGSKKRKTAVEKERLIKEMLNDDLKKAVEQINIVKKVLFKIHDMDMDNFKQAVSKIGSNQRNFINKRVLIDQIIENGKAAPLWVGRPGTMPDLTCNIEVIKTPSVILKLLQTIFAAICVGLYNNMNLQLLHESEPVKLYFLFVVINTFLLSTSVLLISSLVSNMSANMIPKTFFEFLYHLFASIAYLATSLTFTERMVAHDSTSKEYADILAITILSLLNAVLYCLSTYFSYKSYRS